MHTPIPTRSIKISKALVILNKTGAETIVLTLDAPTVYPSLSSTRHDPEMSAPHVTMQVESGVGVRWVRENLGIEPETIRRGF
jgi:hypothetical protein